MITANTGTPANSPRPRCCWTVRWRRKRQPPEPTDRDRNAGRGRRFAVPVALLLLSSAGCGLFGPDVEEITELPRPLTAGEIEVIRASNRFAFDLLAQANRADENLFLSPLSASMALGMTMNGADGETWDQMRDVLGFGNLAEEEINSSYKSLVELLVGLDPTVETAIGNSVWTRSGFPVYPDFLNAVREDFDAEAVELDFRSPSALKRINEWVRDATRGRIEDIVDVIPANAVMYLLNAIYFKGSWTLPFDPSHTRTEPFHLDDGSTQNVPLMALDGTLSYQSNSRFQAVDLPYGGRAFAMTVLLPRQGVSVDTLAATLDAGEWEDIADGFSDARMQLFLPRFRMSYERTLNGDLAALGMVDAFDPARADLTRLSPVEPLYISEVKQKSWVDVNEEGTEAAAVTSVVVVTSQPPEFRADRPFLFFIRERLSGTILFAGKFASPPAE
ncbi:MAG: serpin family protein [Gemmatimonadetes bacterium]|nr:serpin family protein [Gemmatimonadota bacterium]